MMWVTTPRCLPDSTHTALSGTAHKIKYFYDGYNYATYKAAGLTAKQWAPFMKPQYLLLNLAIGGTSGGPVDDTKFPFTYEVDYVRYYQKQ
jgi:beta-glucanase (GH16 family)